VTVAVIILAIVPAASIASSGDHLYRINPQRGSKSCPKKLMRMFSPKRGCRWPALAAGRNQLTNATLAALFVPADTQRVKKAPGVPGLEVTKHLEGEL